MFLLKFLKMSFSLKITPDLPAYISLYFILLDFNLVYFIGLKGSHEEKIFILFMFLKSFSGFYYLSLEVLRFKKKYYFY